MKYKVYVMSKSLYVYEVVANSREEAEEQWGMGNWVDCQECPDYDIEAEEVMEVKEVD